MNAIENDEIKKSSAMDTLKEELSNLRSKKALNGPLIGRRSLDNLLSLGLAVWIRGSVKSISLTDRVVDYCMSREQSLPTSPYAICINPDYDGCFLHIPIPQSNASKVFTMRLIRVAKNLSNGCYFSTIDAAHINDLVPLTNRVTELQFSFKAQKWVIVRAGESVDQLTSVNDTARLTEQKEEMPVKKHPSELVGHVVIDRLGRVMEIDGDLYYDGKESHRFIREDEAMLKRDEVESMGTQEVVNKKAPFTDAEYKLMVSLSAFLTGREHHLYMKDSSVSFVILTNRDGATMEKIYELMDQINDKISSVSHIELGYVECNGMLPMVNRDTGIMRMIIHAK